MHVGAGFAHDDVDVVVVCREQAHHSIERALAAGDAKEALLVEGVGSLHPLAQLH